MTHHTDAELLPCPFCGGKAEAKKPDMSYEFTLIKCQECDAQSDERIDLEDAAEAWNRRAPAAPVPQGWKLVPVESTEAMARAFRADDAPGYFCMTTLRCADFSERYAAMLAAAPQPLEGLKRENPATKPEAAPVQLPEPSAWMLGCQTMGGDVGWKLSWSKSGAGVCHRLSGEEFEHPLYTEQQVRQLLANHGIQERST